MGPPPLGWPPFEVPTQPAHNRSSLLPALDPHSGPPVGSIQLRPPVGVAPAGASAPAAVAGGPPPHADEAGGGDNGIDLNHDPAVVLGALAAAVLLVALACIAAVRRWKHTQRAKTAGKGGSKGGSTHGGKTERSSSCGSKRSTGSYRVRALRTASSQISAHEPRITFEHSRHYITTRKHARWFLRNSSITE